MVGQPAEYSPAVDECVEALCRAEFAGGIYCIGSRALEFRALP